MNNKLNLNNVATTPYTHATKKESIKSDTKPNTQDCHTINNGNQAAECYGRILVKQADKTNNAEMVKNVKDSIEFFVKNPNLAKSAVKASDDAFEILSAIEAANAYEKACCGILDAAYNKH